MFYVSDVRAFAYLYHDERRKADEIDHLMRRIVELETLIDNKEFWSREEVWEHIEQAFKTNDSDLGREGLLSLYRRKDVLEKMFDVIKNELESVGG